MGRIANGIANVLVEFSSSQFNLAGIGYDFFNGQILGTSTCFPGSPGIAQFDSILVGHPNRAIEFVDNLQNTADTRFGRQERDNRNILLTIKVQVVDVARQNDGSRLARVDHPRQLAEKLVGD